MHQKFVEGHILKDKQNLQKELLIRDRGSNNFQLFLSPPFIDYLISPTSPLLCLLTKYLSKIKGITSTLNKIQYIHQQ